MLRVVLYVLSIIAADAAHAQNHPWYSSNNLYIADTETIHIVDTRNIYIDLRNCYIADSAAIHIVDTRNIHVVPQDTDLSEQSIDERRLQAYDLHIFLLKMSNSSKIRHTKSQNKYIAPPISNIPDAPSPAIAAQVSASAHSPWWPSPSDIPTKREENAWVATSSVSSSLSKSKIHQATLYAYIVCMRYRESTYIRRYRSPTCPHQRNNKDVFLNMSVLRGPPVMRFNC